MPFGRFWLACPGYGLERVQLAEAILLPWALPNLDETESKRVSLRI